MFDLNSNNDYDWELPELRLDCDPLVPDVPDVPDVPGGLGNTNPNPPKRARVDIKSRAWCFTIWKHKCAEEEDGAHFARTLGVYKEFCFQLEKGDSAEGNHFHYQGWVRDENPIRFNKLKELLGDHVHLQKAKGSKKHNYAYCTKSEGRIEGPWVKGFPLPVRDPLQGKTLYKWQQYVVDLVSDECTDDRIVHWYWDSSGKKGKTALAKHLFLKWPGKVLYLGGKSADVKYAVAKHISDGNELRVAFFNLSRTQEQYVSYQSFEELKDGIIFSSKYESGNVVFNSPHIVVFANFAPNLERLSMDRWKVVNLLSFNDQ